MHIPIGNSGCHGHGFASSHTVRDDNWEPGVCVRSWRFRRGDAHIWTLRLTEITKSASSPQNRSSNNIFQILQGLGVQKKLLLFPYFIVSSLIFSFLSYLLSRHLLLGCGAEEILAFWAWLFLSKRKVPGIPR